jgi:hypothetical protein
MTVVRGVPLVLAVAVEPRRAGMLAFRIDTATTWEAAFEGCASSLRELIPSPRVEFAR